MLKRLACLATLLLVLPAPGHQGAEHPTGLDKCEDVYLAMSWFHLFGEGVESRSSQNPFQPQEYFISNDQPEGVLPRALVKLGWAMGSKHVSKYSDFITTVRIGNSRTYVGIGGGAGTQFLIDPLIDGWAGTMTVVAQHRSCPVTMYAEAHWAFEDPRDPDKCKKCTTLTCDGQAAIKSVDLGIPVGPTRFGRKQVLIGYDSEQVANEGQAKLAVLGPVGDHDASVTTDGDLLTSVTAGNHFARITSDPDPDDPERMRIDVSYDPDDPDNSIYRTAVLQSTAGPDPEFVYTDTVAGRTSTRRFAQPSGDTWTLTENDLRRTSKEKLAESPTQRTYRFTTEERDADGSWVVVAQRDETETKGSWGWRVTERVVDPLGAALTTSWDFYELTEYSGPNGDIHGRGLVQSVTLPTGLVRTYEYHDTDPLDPAFDRLNVTTEAFAGTPGARVTRVHSKFEAPFYTQLREVLVDGQVIERTEIESRSDGGGNYRIERRYPSDGGTPEVTRYDYNTRSLSRKLLTVTKPDGTVEITHESIGDGQTTRSQFNGVPNPHSSSRPLLTGTVERITTSENGQVLHESRGTVHLATEYPIEERIATSLDHLERPLTYEVYHGARGTPTYTETVEYGCCGIARETGEDGITTHYFYDELNRLVKTHRNGLATETVYDGLTTRIHTYPESTPSGLSLATPENESGFITRNLAGHTVAEATRSPQDGSLVVTTTATSYAPAPGLGRRVVTTSPPTADDLGVPATITQDFFLGGLPAATYGPLVPDQQLSYQATPSGLAVTTARLDHSGVAHEATTTQHDWLGRSVTVTYSGDADGDSQPDQALTEYDSGGRPVKVVDPDGVTTLFDYDLDHRITTAALDLDRDGAITVGADEIRISQHGQFLDGDDHLIIWEESRIRDDADQERTLSRQEARADGREATGITYDDGLPLATRTETQYLGPGDWDLLTNLPDGRRTTQRFRGGLVAEEESRDATGTVLATLQYAYDARHRVAGVTDSSGPDTQTAYVSPHLDLFASVSRGGHTTSFTYDHRGRITVVDAPDSVDAGGNPVDNRRTTSWFPHGAIREVTGTSGHHLSYSYDHAHRMETLTTHGPSPTTTRWSYDPDRGWLDRKLYDSPTPGTGTGPAHTYTAAGRLATRLSERGITTNHSYDPGGRLATTAYSDGTPSVTILDRDSRGRVTRLADAGGIRSLSYNDHDNPTATTYEAGHLFAGWTMTRDHDPLGRLTGLTVEDGGTDHHHLGYSYDAASRPEAIVSHGLTAWYHYDPQSHRVAQLSVTGPAGPLVHATRSYDALNRLQRISYHNGKVHNLFQRHADHQVTRDAFGNITRLTRTDGAHWDYGFTPRGELADADLRTDTDTLVPGHHLAWTYDGIGNRTTRTTSTPPVSSSYITNKLNQYSSVQSPGLAEVFGEAPPGTEVLVNGATATRLDRYFHRAVPTDNSGGPVWQSINVENEGPTTTGHLPVPPATTSPTHDAEGNQLTNGLWQFTWDAENRLTRVESTPAATAAGLPYRRITYLYDAKHRRIQRRAFDAPTATTPTEATRYLYAGWRCLAELDASNLPLRTFAWGLDNNDSLHFGDPNGALLWIHDHQANESHLTHYDHNGNITGLLSAQSGQPTATYAYSPFGRLLTATGPYATRNPYRFSTQHQDPATGLLYYGHRHLDPHSGRFLSRDPLEEAGGLNLYAFAANNPLNNIDILGLALYAFDGTGNTLDQNTHVGMLFHSYEGRRHHIRGVGTTKKRTFASRLLSLSNGGALHDGFQKSVGGVTGYGGRARLETMYREFQKNFAAGDETVDIIGFSRGAALARAFANLLNERGFIDPRTGKCRQVKIRFIGLFDTVGSFGIPGNHTNWGYSLDIPPNVAAVAHAVAKDEKRALFPVSLLNKPRPDQSFHEGTFRGDHSDIGGGHGDDTNMLSEAPLEFVHLLGRFNGVPFGDLPQRNLKRSWKPHDLSRTIGGRVGPWLLTVGKARYNPIQPRNLPDGLRRW